MVLRYPIGNPQEAKERVHMEPKAYTIIQLPRISTTVQFEKLTLNLYYNVGVIIAFFKFNCT